MSPFLPPGFLSLPLPRLREDPEQPLTYLADMEDAHTALLKLDEDSGNAFFAVFDGHGGAS